MITLPMLTPFSHAFTVALMPGGVKVTAQCCGEADGVTAAVMAVEPPTTMVRLLLVSMLTLRRTPMVVGLPACTMKARGVPYPVSSVTLAGDGGSQLNQNSIVQPAAAEEERTADSPGSV